METLTAFDIVVLLAVALAAIGGLMRGFVGEVASLLAWVAGFAAVRFLHEPVRMLMTPYMGSSASAAILSVATLFLAAFILVRISGDVLSRNARASLIGPVDRLLGFGFGITKGVLASVLLFLLTTLTFEMIDKGKPAPQWLTESRTAPTLAILSKALVDFVEQQRRVDADSAEADPHAGMGLSQRDGDGSGEGGYADEARSALEALLDKQEEREPSTPI